LDTEVGTLAKYFVLRTSREDTWAIKVKIFFDFKYSYEIRVGEVKHDYIMPKLSKGDSNKA
jgi:hypothetical protein